MNVLPQLVRAPGLGLALVGASDDKVQRGYPQANREECLAFAIDFANWTLRGARRQAGAPLHIAEISADWTAAGGILPAEPLAPYTPPHPSQIADIMGDVTDPHSGGLEPAQQDALLAHFTAHGLHTRRRGDGGESAILAMLGEVVVFEIVDRVGKVVSEGKGLSESAALTSALAEGAERVVAHARPSHAFYASAAELQAQGVAIPALQATVGDLYSNELPLEWIAARTFSGVPGAIPAELACYPFTSATGVRSFTGKHTSGLAAGASREVAGLAGLRECIETDAYWLSMRTRHVGRRFDDLQEAENPSVCDLVRKLSEVGVRVWAGDISFDWPFAIAHVVLETEAESLPAVAHGLGSGSTPLKAVKRALYEAVQVYSGLEKVAVQHWPDISVAPFPIAEPAIVWSSPHYATRLTEPHRDAPSASLGAITGEALSNISDLLPWMTERGFTAWGADLGSLHGLHVSRVLLEGAVSPFSERSGPSQRVLDTVKRLGLPYPYLDPVLT